MKISIPFVLILFLSGCSLFTSYDPHLWMQQFGTLIQQDNKNDQQIASISQLNQQINTLAAAGNTNKTSEIVTLIEQQQKLIATYQQNVTQLKNKLPALAENGADLDSDASQQLAEQAIVRFTQLIQTELQYAKLLNETFAKNKAFFTTVNQGDNAKPAATSMKQLEQQIAAQEKKLKQAIQALNQVSQKFQAQLSSTSS